MPLQYDPLTSVPAEITEMITELLDPLDIIRLERVSRDWTRILRCDRVYSSALKRFPAVLQFFEDIDPLDSRLSGDAFCRQAKRWIRKELAWVKDGPIVNVAIKKEGFQQVHGLDDFCLNIDFGDDRMSIREPGRLAIVSLSDILTPVSIPDFESQHRSYAARLTTICADYLVRRRNSYIQVFDPKGIALKYSVLAPFVNGPDEFACHDGFFTGIRDFRLVIWDAKTGVQREDINLLDLVETESTEGIIDPTSSICYDFAITKGTIVIRFAVHSSESPFCSFHLFFISGMDNSVRRHIALDPSYCDKFGSGHCQTTTISSIDSCIDISYFYLDQQNHETATYDVITFDSSTDNFDVSEEFFDLDWSEHFKGISPNLVCKINDDDDGEEVDSEDESGTDSKTQVIQILGHAHDGLKVVNEWSMNITENVSQFLADQDWIVILDAEWLHIMGFDELKCQSLKESVERCQAKDWVYKM
jgi:hypothetical protein